MFSLFQYFLLKSQLHVNIFTRNIVIININFFQFSNIQHIRQKRKSYNKNYVSDY